MKRIGLLTSGGDAPGMNAAIRAVVRSALARDVEVFGFQHGWQGVIEGDGALMNSKSVGGIISLGGTILQSARSSEFRTAEGRQKAKASLDRLSVEGLVVVGGDGSLTGARIISSEHGVPVIGLPGSIDNDIPGTDFSIGFDTAVNTARDAIDKVRDTAYSHDRVFVVEVMGRHNGFIAVDCALACGAEAVLIPEVPFSLMEICANLKEMRDRGKKSSIIIVAEGAARGHDVEKYIDAQAGFEARCVVLGHMQRGGSPSAFDRVLALRMGSLAANRLISGYSGEMIGMDRNRLVSHPLNYVLGTKKAIDPEKLLLVDVMAR